MEMSYVYIIYHYLSLFRHMNYEELINILYISRSYIYFITSVLYCYFTIKEAKNTQEYLSDKIDILLEKTKEQQQLITQLQQDIINISMQLEHTSLLDTKYQDNIILSQLPNVSTVPIYDGPSQHTRSKSELNFN